MKQWKEQAKGDPVAMAAIGGGTLLQPQNWGKMIADWAVERRFANDADKLASIITSPDGISRLKELRQMSPTSAKRWALTGQLLSPFTEGPLRLDGKEIKPQSSRGRESHPPKNFQIYWRNK